MRAPFAVCQFLEGSIKTLVISDGLCELLGYTDRAQAYSDINHNMYKDIHPEDTARFTNALLRFGTGDDRLEMVYRSKKMDDSGYRLLHLTGEHVYPEEGYSLAQIWFTDEGDYEEDGSSDLDVVTKKGLPEDTFVDANRYDYLTGLPNMTYFFEIAEIGRKTLLTQGGLPALLYIDLSGMKYYNHKYGFSEGDNLLRYFARLLGRTFHTTNCCHITADRFAAFTCGTLKQGARWKKEV